MQAIRGVVSIMDLVMFEAQRQGRLSFYMVYYNCFPPPSPLHSLTMNATANSVPVGGSG